MLASTAQWDSYRVHFARDKDTSITLETVVSAPQKGTVVGTVLLIACNEIKTFRVYIATYVFPLKINTSASTVWLSATLNCYLCHTKQSNLADHCTFMQKDSNSVMMERLIAMQICLEHTHSRKYQARAICPLPPTTARKRGGADCPRYILALKYTLVIGIATMGARGVMAPPDFTKVGPDGIWPP